MPEKKETNPAKIVKNELSKAIDRMAETPVNYFTELNSIDVSKHTEKKNGLTYLSWPWAWGELKKRHPDATYTIYENRDGWNYFHDGGTCWVKTGVTVNGIEHIEYLPVMDYKNKSIPLGSVTSFEVNKAIQRSLTKAIARHGLGLYLYAGEDLPDTDDGTAEAKKTTAKPQTKTETGTKNDPPKTCRDQFRDYIAEKRPSNDVIVEILNKSGAKDDSDDVVWFEALCLAKKKLG